MTTGGSTNWRRHNWRGTADEFHHLSLPIERSIWWCSVTAPALVVGSSQSLDVVLPERAEHRGLQIAHRRSGGGVVFVHPDDSVWIDITIPRDDPLWVDDVSASMLWVGDVFVRALSPWVNATVWTHPFDAGSFGRHVCFASAAPGEVFVGDHKLVGISQRRTRDNARFQCVLYRHWNPDVWSSCLVDGNVADAVRHIHVATVDAGAADIVDSVVVALATR